MHRPDLLVLLFLFALLFLLILLFLLFLRLLANAAAEAAPAPTEEAVAAEEPPAAEGLMTAIPIPPVSYLIDSCKRDRPRGQPSGTFVHDDL